MLNQRMFAGYSQVAAALVAGAVFFGAAGEVQAQQQRAAAGQAGSFETTQTIASAQAEIQTIFVNAAAGSDRAEGLESQPLQTVTHALEVASPNTVIVLAPGLYTQASGEVFPLQLKPGVTIQGTPGSGNRTAIIQGGGEFESATRSQQNATIVAADRAGIAQVAVSNPDGYGLWVESASPTIIESAFVGSRRAGIYVTDSSPRVQGSFFSGNKVAGMIVFGVSSATIHGNTFDSTGDAIRVVDGATPEIVGNSMTNNDASLVLIGDASPIVRDNRVVGNRRDDVVAVSARTRDIMSSTVLADEEIFEKEPWPGAVSDEASATLAAFEEPEPAIEPDSVEALEETDFQEVEVIAQASTSEPQAGAPGAALAALRAGTPNAGGESSSALSSGVPIAASRAASDARDDSPTIRPRRIRNPRPDREPENRPGRSPSRPESRPAPPSNNNRLAVPNSSIPIGGGSGTIFSPPRGGVGSPPAPPSRAQALGLYYRVFVNASDPFMQDEVRSVVPDAFRTQFEGRTVMQVGAFPTEDEAEDRQRLLEDYDLDARVEYIR